MLALPIWLAGMDVHHYDVACVRSARVEISSQFGIPKPPPTGGGTSHGRPRAEARPTGARGRRHVPVSKERLRDCDGQLDVCAPLSAKACQRAKWRVGV